jgi:hypothetical protein
MPKDLNPIEATSGMKTPGRSSAAVRLLQVAALAAALVPLGSVVAEASPMPFNPELTSETYSFDVVEGLPFTFTLTFAQVFDQFSVDVEASTTLGLPTPPGSVCVPIAGPEDCVDFTATTTAVKGTDFSSSGYTATVDWTFDTDPNFPNTGGQQVELLESHAGNPFVNITIPGSYMPGCVDDLPCGDPGISGTSDSFSVYRVVDTTVPEPATLALLGSGLAGLLMRRRQRTSRAS